MFSTKAPFSIIVLLIAAASTSFVSGQKVYKNVIMLIPDGCDEAVLSLARLYKDDQLTVDHMKRAAILANMANSLMTDSAPGGTAYAAGIKTSDKFIGVGPKTDDLLTYYKNDTTLIPPYAPMATVLEGAQLLGKSVGLVSTSKLSHATPASFSAHVDARSKETEIALHQVFHNLDVAMGGGRQDLLPASSCSNAVVNNTGIRADCLNLVNELKHKGYKMCGTRDELLSLTTVVGEKVWCNFASGHMAPDIDRKLIAPTEPSLKEMTMKAIEILSKNPNGFFLMVEGSEVDWAGHANDPIWMATDFIAWDMAVKVANDFAMTNNDTLIMAMPDHNTGGLKVGNYKFRYTDRTVEFGRDPLLKMTATSNVVVASMGVSSGQAPTPAQLRTAVLTYWGINLTDTDITTVLEYSGKYSTEYLSNPGTVLPLSYGLSRLVSEVYTIAGWTSHGHTGETIPLWLKGMEPPKKLLLNTDIGKMAASALGVDLPAVSATLYVDLNASAMPYLVDVSNVKNQIATIKNAIFPLGTNYYTFNGVNTTFKGTTVYAPVTKKLYISQDALKKLNDTVTAPVTPPVAVPVTPPVTAPITAPVAAPVTPPVAAPVTAPVKPPVAAPVTPPVAAPVTPPVAAPVTAPVKPPVAAPVTAPVAAPVTSPVASPVTAPVTTSDKRCGLLGLRLFCFNGCGFFGRLLGLCK